MATTPQGLTQEQINQIIAAGRGSSVNIGGTLYQGHWDDQRSGESMQEGPLQNIYGTTGIGGAGQPYQIYDPTGAYTGQGVTQKVDTSLGGAIKDITSNPGFKILLAAYGANALAGSGGLLGGGAAGTAGVVGSDLAGLSGIPVGTGALTAAEAASLYGIPADVWAAEMAAAAPASEVAAATAAANAATTGLTSAQIANLAKAGISIAGLTAANKLVSTPTTATPTTPITYSGGGAGGYSPDYFSQVQSTYNQLMPNVPRDVASPLQKWYSTEFNPGASVTGSLFGDMTGGATGGMAPNTGVKPVTAPVVKPVTTLPPTVKPPVVVPPVVVPPTTTTTPVVPVGSTAYQWATNQGGMTPNQYLNNINQWILDNPNASLADINAVKSKLGVSDVDVQTALGASNFSDATKYALTHGMGLSDVNQNIVNWIAKNPAATNAQIQAEQAKYSVSDADIARALTEQNASAAKEYAIIHDMGLDTYYKNIANAAQSGITPQEAVAQMQQYGVSPADVKQAYSMFAPAGGLTLDEVLAAYNK